MFLNLLYKIFGAFNFVLLKFLRLFSLFLLDFEPLKFVFPKFLALLNLFFS